MANFDLPGLVFPTCFLPASTRILEKAVTRLVRLPEESAFEHASSTSSRKAFQSTPFVFHLALSGARDIVWNSPRETSVMIGTWSEPKSLSVIAVHLVFSLRSSVTKVQSGELSPPVAALMCALFALVGVPSFLHTRLFSSIQSTIS